jgi:magnesium transporter
MRHKKQKRKSKLGMPPGSLVFTGEQKMANVDINAFNYDETFSVEHKPQSLSDVEELIRNTKGVTWINIDGLHDESFIEGLSTFLDIHKLTMEDILSVGQRPKLEEHSNYLHVVIKEITLNQTEEIIEYEQISFILKDNILVSFQERAGDLFDGVRKRIREGKGTIRKRGADYLMYALLDNVVDHYFVVLENFGEKLEDLETELLENPNNHTLTKLHNFRRETLGLRRTVYPLRELIAAMEKLDDPIFTRENKVFTRDLYDHIIKVIETVEIFRDMTSSLLDLYINSVSNKTNEIMKVLTILTSIFIPLSFISGVYGMNFQNMPELTYKYGYFVILGLMAAVFAGMLIFLRRKKWL